VSAATYTAAQLVRAMPRVRLSHVVGRLCEQRLPPPLSRAVTAAYARAYGIDLSEAAPESGPYPTFDAFFTRPLRPGARVVEDAPLVSPADGKLEAAGTIASGAVLEVKGKPYEVGELVGEAKDSAGYAGGSFAVIYLSPRDYHRVHAPVDGAVTVVRSIAGDLFPVNAIGERFPRLFVRNHRVAIAVDTESLGRVTVVMVGAMVVGRISVTALGDKTVPIGTHTVSPPSSVLRGDELGRFHLGSTVVVLLEPGLSVTRSLGTVHYGEALVKAAG
jgi:phosphatidylserine decarboxylase